MYTSELDLDLLTEEEKYFIVMHGIIDYTKTSQDKVKNSDLIIVLGCTPIPLRARVLKMMELVRSGASKSVLLSGGKGWTKLLKTPGKKEEMLKAIKETISADLLGDNPTPKRQELQKRFIEGMKSIETAPTYEAEQEKKKLHLTESDFMNLIILTNGGLNGVKFFHEPFSFNTKENMEYTHKLIYESIKRGELQKADKILIVTSAFHCRRAFLTFKREFPDTELIVCPATRDLEDRGFELGKSMLQSEYYKKQIFNECSAIRNYSNNGSIANMSLTDLLITPEMTQAEQDYARKMIAQIEERHNKKKVFQQDRDES